MGVSSPPELVVKFLEPELQAVGWEDEGVSLDSLVKALHKPEEVNRHALCKLLPTGQLGSFSLSYLVCAAGNEFIGCTPLYIYIRSPTTPLCKSLTAQPGWLYRAKLYDSNKGS